MIRFENVGMRYGHGPEILRDLTFTLEQGSFHYLTGYSGAGKSSLMRLLYLSHPPSRGALSIFNQDIMEIPRQKRPDLRRRIGVVFQDFRLLDHLTAYENVALPRRIMGEDDKEYREEVEELLSWVGLGHRFDAMPSTLSGGEKQRVAIARAVIVRPDLLLADEPTGNVDPEMGARILRLLLELNRIGTTVVLATHDPQLVTSHPAPQLHLEKGFLSYVPTGVDPKSPPLPLGPGSVNKEPKPTKRIDLPKNKSGSAKSHRADQRPQLDSSRLKT